MFETLAVAGVLLLATSVVVLKARERLRTPPARRSRGRNGDGGGMDREPGAGGEGGDGGGGD
jgi:hypothetical protein